MKYIVMILVLSISLMAADAAKSAKALGMYNNYNKALQKAKSENKLMVLVVVWDPCRACNKLVKETLSNDIVKNSLKDHVTAILDYKDKMPEEFHIKMAPKIFYINPKTEKSVWESMGAVSIETITDDFKEALEMFKEDSK